MPKVYKGKFTMKVLIIAHNGKGRGSRIIKWATRGRFSHISIRFLLTEEDKKKAFDLFGKEFTLDHEIESIQGLGVHDQPFTPSDNQAWFEFDHTYEQGWTIFRTAVELIGCKYDWRGIGGFATRRNVQNPLKWFCSELAAWCLLKAGIIALKMLCSWITPNIFVTSPIFTEVYTGKTVGPPPKLV